jgi:tricorn protease
LQFVYEQISPWEHEFRNYRGGQNNPLRIFDFLTTQKLPWEQQRYRSCLDGQHDLLSSLIAILVNIWAYDITTKTVQQKTFFKEFDCKNLEGDNETLIFETEVTSIH